MKKKILLITISFFAFSPNVLALSKINRMDIDINIGDDGIAKITEDWQISEGNNNTYEKNFYDVKDVIITDVTLTDFSGSSYQYLEKYNKDRNLIYNYKDSGKKKIIRINTNNKNTTLRLEYKVKGIITKYKDVYAINWELLAANNLLDVGILNAYISGPVEFNETNMALYAIGNNISCEFENGKIHVFASNIARKTKIKIMASLADYEFENYLTNDKSFQEYYDEYKARTPFHVYVEEILDNILMTIIVLLAILASIGFIIYKLIKKDKVNSDYKNIKSYKKNIFVTNLQESLYNDIVPCESDIYKIYFIANYYSIIKHRSSLVGAFIFKCILEGKATIESDDSKFYLRLFENVSFSNPLDKEMYNILVASSSNLILDNTKLIRYATEHPEEIIDWYDKVVKVSIKDEYIKRNVEVKKNNIILNKVIFNEAEKIQGFKKYLLNFNQVPRSTELTEDIYKNSLISSVLLRVDENLYKELLRKNPDNAGALMLEKFSKIKYLYNNIYSISIEEFKKDKHNKREKNRYNPRR